MTADEYLPNVSFWLRDLPWRQRQTLLASPVRYRFLWRTVTAEVPFPEELAIVFKKTNNCS